MAVLADTAGHETEAWARAHADLHLFRLPASLQTLATALDAQLKRFEEAG
jgi:hypothetical protein